MSQPTPPIAAPERHPQASARPHERKCLSFIATRCEDGCRTNLCAVHDGEASGLCLHGEPWKMERGLRFADCDGCVAAARRVVR